MNENLEQAESLLIKLSSIASRLRLRLREQFWQRVSPGKTVRRLLWGYYPDRSSKKLCLFSSYDPDGRVDPYVKAYLAAIRACDFDIAFVATSPDLHSDDVADILPFCRVVLLRKNIGIDFGSWKAATQVLPDWEDYDRLLLANDSVYGPFSDLAVVFEAMEAAKESMLGLTDNFEKAWHLQSYFLYFKRPLLGSPEFKDFWSSIRLYLDKYDIIERFEVGMSRHFLKYGHKLKACFPYADVKDFTLGLGSEFKFRDKLCSEPLNQTLYMWEQLLSQFKFPFLKTEILKINRFGFSQVAQWREKIPSGSPDWRVLIEGHLKRVCPSAAGLNNDH